MGNVKEMERQIKALTEAEGFYDAVRNSGRMSGL